MTEKLYDRDSFIKEFDATVLSCVKTEKSWNVILDRTAFFPESGGQYSDTGTIGGARVLDTRTEGENIIHITNAPLSEGASVRGVLDFDLRYIKMQNHTGEHIVSSVMHRRFGFSNVGFHLNGEETTFDFDGTVTEAEMEEVEMEANSCVYKNAPVRVYYPTEKELETLTYRSKGGIDGKIRIVDIEGIDMCACCAPHVKSTGEIGIIKILGFIRYKGGIRVRMKCGYLALEDYKQRIKREEKVSRLFCVPQEEISAGAENAANEIKSLKDEVSALKARILEMTAESVLPSEKNICLFTEGFSDAELRTLCNLCSRKCGGIFVSLSGSDETGYSFCASSEGGLSEKVKDIRASLCGRCGGSDIMISGKLGAKRKEIENYFIPEGKND